MRRGAQAPRVEESLVRRVHIEFVFIPCSHPRLATTASCYREFQQE